MIVPRPVTRYMEEFEETESGVRGYVLRQVEFFATLRDPATSVEGYVAMKMGCTAREAATAIRWAKKTTGLVATTEQETAQLIREYVEWVLDNGIGNGDLGPYDPLLDAIAQTAEQSDAATAEACCHMGRALICLEQSVEDAKYRLGGDECDPRMTEMARRLGMLATKTGESE